jgi:hypothetical protein
VWKWFAHIEVILSGNRLNRACSNCGGHVNPSAQQILLRNAAWDRGPYFLILLAIPQNEAALRPLRHMPVSAMGLQIVSIKKQISKSQYAGELSPLAK